MHKKLYWWNHRVKKALLVEAFWQKFGSVSSDNSIYISLSLVYVRFTNLWLRHVAIFFMSMSVINSQHEFLICYQYQNNEKPTFAYKL